jgi:hypothetical protein
MSNRKPEHSVIDDRHRIIERFLEKVDIYYKTFGRGIPMKALATAFTKSLQPYGSHGDFVATYSQLQKDGSIQITMNARTAGRAVFPHYADLKQFLIENPQDKLTPS